MFTRSNKKIFTKVKQLFNERKQKFIKKNKYSFTGKNSLRRINIQ
jgi:hypothetical protein